MSGDQPMMEHTEDCVAVGIQECRPASGEWYEPPRWAMRRAADELGVEAPWCRVQRRAWDLTWDEADA